MFVFTCGYIRRDHREPCGSRTHACGYVTCPTAGARVRLLLQLALLMPSFFPRLSTIPSMITEHANSHDARRTSFVHRVLLLSLSFFLILGAVGCKKDPTKPLHGTWGIDHDTFLQEQSAADATEGEKALFRLILENMQFGFRFDKDGHYETYVLVLDEEEQVEGRYRVLSSTKEKLVLELTGADGETSVAEVEMSGKDRLVINLDSTGEDGADADTDTPDTMPFKRISEKEFEKQLASVGASVDQQNKAPTPEVNHEERAKNAGAQRLIGTWMLDPAATVALMPEEQQELASAFVRMMKIGVVFNADKTLEMHVAMMGERDFQAGGYVILEAEDDRLAIELMRDDSIDEEGNPVDDEPSTMIVAFLDNDRIIFQPAASEGQSEAEAAEEALVLKRVTKSELNDALNKPSDYPSQD